MSLPRYPGPWRILVCDFNTGCVPPEMVKRRAVIAVSNNRNDSVKVCSVIPIRSTKPDIIRDYHYLLPQQEMPEFGKDKFPESWIKIDTIETVSFSRLTLPWNVALECCLGMARIMMGAGAMKPDQSAPSADWPWQKSGTGISRWQFFTQPRSLRLLCKCLLGTTSVWSARAASPESAKSS